MNDDLEAIDGLCAKIIEQRDRIEALENALREIIEAGDFWEMDSIARKALAPEQDK